MRRAMEPSWCRAAAVALAALGGCARAAMGIDAGPWIQPDAGRDADAVDATDTVDALGAPGGPTTDVVVRVVVGPSLRPGEGVGVRAELASGYAIETATDARGEAHLALAFGAGPWDVTVARRGLTAVSILDVTGPIEGPIFLEPDDDGVTPPTMPPGARRLAGRVLDVPPNASALELHTDGAWITALGDAGYSGWVAAPPDGGRVTAYALALAADAAIPGAFAAAALATTTNDLGAGDLALDVDFAPDASSPTIRTQTLVVEDGGLFGAADLAGSVRGFARRRVGDSTRHGLIVGTAFMPWGAPTVPARVSLDVFDGAFAPEAVTLWAPICSHDDQPCTRDRTGDLLVVTTDASDGATIRVPPVRDMRLDSGPDRALRVTVDAPAYNASGFAVLDLAGPTVTPQIGHWQGYSFAGAALRAHRVPALPGGLAMDALWGSALLTPVARLDAPSRPPPWSTSPDWTPMVRVRAGR